MLSATEATLESVRNLITCSENIRERLTNEFKDTLRDWASAKTGNDIFVVYYICMFLIVRIFSVMNVKCLWTWSG